MLVALAFAAVVAEPEADAEAHYGLIGYGYSGYPGIYRYNYYGTRGYFGYPYRFGYYGRYWKRDAETDAESQRYYGYGNYPSPAYGMGYAYGMGLGYPRFINNGRFWKRDAEADAAAEAYFQYFTNPYETYGMNSMGYSDDRPQHGYMENNFFPYFSNYYNRYF